MKGKRNNYRFLDELISQLDDEKECVEKLKRMGQAHAVLAKSCGFTGFELLQLVDKRISERYGNDWER